MKLGTAQVIRANSRHLPLADNSVDLVVTSPPYFALRSYQDEELCLRCIEAKAEGRNIREMWPDYAAHAKAEHNRGHYAGQIGDEPTPAEFVDSLLEVTAECMRVLKPSGSLWVNLGDKYAGNGPQMPTKRGYGSVPHLAGPYRGTPAKSLIGIPWRYALRCIDDLGLILRAEVIWSKPNGLPESVTDRVRRSHETWFHFTLQPRYFSAVDEIREAHDPASQAHVSRYTGRDYGKTNGARGDLGASNFVGNPLGKLPGSVWTVPTEPLRVPDHLGIDHFAAFPTAWPRKIISAWCPEDGTVLDPFGGTGTTALVAKALGRHGVTVDMSADYCRLATWRTNDRNQLAKVLGVEKTDAPDADQLDLFGGDAA